MVLKNFINFINNYGQGRKSKLGIFFVLSLFAGLFEFVGIALVYPFVLMIISPQTVEASKYYHYLIKLTESYDTFTNTIAIGTLVIGLFLFKNCFMVFCTRMQSIFTRNWKVDLAKIFMQYYLYSPYKNSLSTSVSEKNFNLSVISNQALDGYIIRVINLITQFTITSMILILLVIKFPTASFVTIAFVILSLGIQNKYFKKKLRKISSLLINSSQKYNKICYNNVSNLKELKILSAEDYFYNTFLESKKETEQASFLNIFYASIPPYIVEMLVVFALMILGCLIIIQENSSSEIIASFAIVVAAIFRIAPALNRIQSSINAINTNVGFVKQMNAQKDVLEFSQKEKIIPEKIEFKEKIELENINFGYNSTIVLKNISLKINKGDFIGIIGLSGAGKSTLVDVLMGLLPLNSGGIKIDGINLTEERFAGFLNIVGYVPQQINIIDGSFKENVAFGIAPEKINTDRVEYCLKAAQLWDVAVAFGGIDKDFIIGANGLSQGQKQRLALARALYRDPQLIILDEATSALDVKTEHDITEMLNDIKGNRTIIAVAHRLSTLKKCNKLVYMIEGEIIDIGSFEELSQKHKDFENLINLSKIQN